MVHFKNNAPRLKGHGFCANDFACSSPLKSTGCSGRINKHGFTLVEVIVATALMGMLLSPLFISQEQLMKSVRNMSVRLSHMIESASFMARSRQEAIEEKLEGSVKKEMSLKKPSAQLTYTQEPSKIALLKDFKDIYIERVTVNWRDSKRAHSTTFNSFLFKPKKEKKNQ